MAGSLPLGVIAGPLLAGRLADLLRRRRTKFIGGAICTAAAPGSAFARR